MEFALFVLWLLYLTPFLLAAARRHESVTAIAFANFFFGWTGIGWLAILAWALRPAGPASGRRRRRPQHLRLVPQPASD